VNDLIETMSVERRNQNVDVIGHDALGEQVVPDPVEMEERFLNDFGNLRAAKPAGAISTI